MKCWLKYEQFLHSGEWHVHTSYTDGNNSVVELCRRACDLGIPLISFTEHVRKDMDYDFSKFLHDVDRAKDLFPRLVVLSGIEAKVLSDGSLDVEDDILRRVSYATFSFHSFPREKALYFACLKKAIENDYVNAWDHPGLFLEKSGLSLSDDELCDVFGLMKRHDVLLEINGKYGLPHKKWIDMASEMGVKTVRGNDIHRLEDFENRKKIWW